MAPSHMSREFDAGEVLGRGPWSGRRRWRAAHAPSASGACNGDGFASVDAAAASAATTALAAVASVVRVCLAASASAVALARALDASSDAFCALAFASAAAAAAAFPRGTWDTLILRRWRVVQPRSPRTRARIPPVGTARRWRRHPGHRASRAPPPPPPSRSTFAPIRERPVRARPRRQPRTPSRPFPCRAPPRCTCRIRAPPRGRDLGDRCRSVARRWRNAPAVPRNARARAGRRLPRRWPCTRRG